MPSIRVKRGEYTSLADVQEGPTRQPLSRDTYTQPPPSSPPPQRTLTEHPTIARHNGRQRSSTSGTGGSDAPSFRKRRPSRVSEHILAARRASRAASRRYKDVDANAEDTQKLRSQEQPPGVGGSGREMVALQGSHEQIVYSGNRQHPGLVGSALSLPDSIESRYSQDDFMHHDDIVEHLDVIGAYPYCIFEFLSC